MKIFSRAPLHAGPKTDGRRVITSTKNGILLETGKNVNLSLELKGNVERDFFYRFRIMYSCWIYSTFCIIRLRHHLFCFYRCDVHFTGRPEH